MTETSTSVTPAAGEPFHAADSKTGVFNDYETVSVPMSSGTACAFYLATTQEGIYYGFHFFIRSPRNDLKELPKIGAIGTSRRTAEAKKKLLLWLVDGHAHPFFADHKAASKHLQQFRQLVAEEKPLPETAALPVQALVDASADDAPVAAPIAAETVKEAPVERVMGAQIPVTPALPRSRYESIPVADIEVNPKNPRKSRTPEAFAELVESIKAQGELLQPIAVEDLGEHIAATSDHRRYRLIFGEGRWLAHRQLGWPMIEAKVYTGVNATDVLEKSLIENLSREDMNAMDEAEGFAELSHLGRTPAQMAERTGKDVRTIYKALGLMKLPEDVRAMIRSGDLSARQGRSLMGWVAPAVNEKRDHFIARPEVCSVIARVAVEKGISSDELVGIPAQALDALIGKKLLAEVDASYSAELERRGLVPEVYFKVSPLLQLFSWDVEGWKELKKQIDTVAREAAKKLKEKASKRVQAGTAGNVSIPLATLSTGKVDHVVMNGEFEKFVDYLPESSMGTSIGAANEELIVCLRPDYVKKLASAYRIAIEDDLANLLPELHARATAKLKKLKRVGARELAMIVADPTVPMDGAAFREQGVKVPKDLMRESIAKMDPVQLVRVYLQSVLINARENALSAEGEAVLLRWVLEVDQLGLIEESPAEIGRLLTKLSAQIFGSASPAPIIAPTPAKEKKPAKKAKR